jgi:formiminoglutamase
MNPVMVTEGMGPIILAQPHSGTYVPDAIWANLNSLGRELTDTDWHVPTLYEGLLETATIVKANFSRYVIDANRDPSGISLYPGENTTGLVPLTNFDNLPIWTKPPSLEDIAYRVTHFHTVYHQSLKREITRIKAIHGRALVYDCHSIRSLIPFLFDKKLPDFNIGDNSGKSCDVQITNAVKEVCSNAPFYSHVVNGRFKGGWTTRHYGQPADNVHALQMELAQHQYLLTEQAPFNYSPFKAGRLREVLKSVLSEIERLIIIKT